MVEVYFLPFEKFDKLGDFFDQIKIFKLFKTNEKVGLKIHFGNSSHKNQISPNYISPIINILKNINVSQFLTDTNVLYRGERDNIFSHLELAYKNGFGNLGIPILIAGGSKGDYEFEIKINGKHFKKLYFAKEYKELDGMIALTHFKGHMLSGIGGTIKNIGMGCASRKGKFAMHSKLTPQINNSICKLCEICVKNCLFEAMHVKNEKVYINPDKCKGCAQCIHICPSGAINIPWSSVSSEEFQEKLVEYAYGIIKFYKKFIAVNFIINITGDCDCASNPGQILSKNIGVCVSNDPVAVDKCSVDLIKEINGYDIFLKFRPSINHNYQFEYAEKIGLGTTKYKLIEF